MAEAEILDQLKQYYILLAQGKSQEAEKLKSSLTQAIQNLPEESYKKLRKNIYKSAINLFEQENWEYACIYFDLAVLISELRGEEFPLAKKNSSIAHNNYAVLLADTGRVKEAEEHFLKALELNPDYPRAHMNYGILLYETGRVKEAEEHYSKALELKPDYAHAHNNYAALLADTGRTEEAEEHLKKASELALKDKLLKKEICITIQKNYAEILYRNQRYSESAKQFKKTYLLDRDNLDLFLWSIYVKYLEAEYNQRWLIPEEQRKKAYEEKIHHLLSETRDFQAEIEKKLKERKLTLKNFFRIFKKPEKKEKKPKKKELLRSLSWLHYFQAIVFCQIEDYSSALWHSRKSFQTHPRMKCFLVRFWRWFRNEREYSFYKSLLLHIWNYKFKPPFYRWWLSSPRELGWGIKCTKIIIFGLTAGVLGWFVAWIFIWLLALIRLDYFLSLLVRFRSKDYEIEMIPPGKLTLTPILMERLMPKSEK